MTRIEKLLHVLTPNTAYLIADPIDIFYLTGQNVSSGILVVGKKSFLLVDGRYFESCKKSSPIPVYLIKEGLLFELVKDSLIVDQDHITYGAYLKLAETAKKAGITIRAEKSLLKSLRAIKNKEEIALLKEASELGLQGFDYAASLLKEGITELEIACELEYFWRKKGAQGVAFEPIIAFGANSAMPHYRASNATLKRDDIALIDIGVKWKHYHSDMTRVVFFGNPNSKLKEIHAVVKKALDAALNELRPGVALKEIDGAARNLIVKHGYGEYFTHSLGHGVGLEIHEFPIIKSALPIGDVLLKAGMVVTIEPGIYIPKLGGVRLEDTVVITVNGYENLTTRDYA